MSNTTEIDKADRTLVVTALLNIASLAEEGSEIAEEAQNALAVLGLEVVEVQECDPEPDESMDGDHETALRDAGWGTDEDYGYFGGDED